MLGRSFGVEAGKWEWECREVTEGKKEEKGGGGTKAGGPWIIAKSLNMWVTWTWGNLWRISMQMGCRTRMI